MFSERDFSISYRIPSGFSRVSEAQRLLMRIAEDSYCENLTALFQRERLHTVEERFQAGVHYFAEAGYGRLGILCARREYGEVAFDYPWDDLAEILHQVHNARPVEYIVSGFIGALFAAAYGLIARAYLVRELLGIGKAGRVIYEVNMR